MSSWLSRARHDSETQSSLVLLSTLAIRVNDPQNKVDHDCEQKHNGQHGRTEAVIETSLAPLPYALGTPMVGRQGVNHGEHGHAGEEEGRDEGGPVAEVEHANGQRAEDDGEVEP